MKGCNESERTSDAQFVVYIKGGGLHTFFFSSQPGFCPIRDQTVHDVFHEYAKKCTVGNSLYFWNPGGNVRRFFARLADKEAATHLFCIFLI